MRLTGLLLIFLAAGCSQKSGGDPLVGDYVAWAFVGGEAMAADGSRGAKQTLTLLPGGKFKHYLEITVIYDVKLESTGTYERVRDGLVLTGTATVSIDDGTKKDPESKPFELKLEVVDGVLVNTDDRDVSTYYRKVGTGPPPTPPEAQLSDSDPKAVALIREVQTTYRSLTSLAVTGTTKSDGSGSMPKSASFKLLFQRPKQFRFETVDLLGERDKSEQMQVTWDGVETCWWVTNEFGESSDCNLGNSLSFVFINAGVHVPLLLALLNVQGYPPANLVDDFKATLLTDETISGQTCSVLQLRGKDGKTTKLWAAKSSNLLLRVHDEQGDQTVNLDPKANAPIKAEDFKLGQRSD